MGGILAFTIFQPIQVRPRIRLGPGFSLIDQNGQRLTNEDLRGHLVLYSFIYTRCQSKNCDYVTQTLQAVQAGLAERVGELPVTLLTISFDPAHDTPEVLQAYAQEVGADPNIWRFATGDPARLKQIIGQGFEIYYAPNENGTATDGSEAFKFDPGFVLVDGWGIVRSEYQFQTIMSNVERILHHVNVIEEEALNSTGGAKVAYEAAHLFLCYAP